MKKYFLLALMAVSLVSCEEELSTNTPTLEVMNGYTFWRANNLAANVNSDGDLVIVGVNESENVTLFIDNYEFGGEYTLGVSNLNVATYSKTIDDKMYLYSTSSSTGKGYIKLNPVEKQVPGTISGTFMAEMVPVDEAMVLPEMPIVNLNKGVFFRIPLSYPSAAPQAPKQ
ncbi:DUF6252 family protein [Flavobacterium sp. CBA20B-1]|uniref:DUF6252 family protein n=1 Tax=unclassified Flavobacterium TaxID=196869 RepID=UPI0022240BEC|nr:MULTISPECIES: DUF6252 family protein [unclassified Flavobacterium]WCM40901.1 DUF6252 family protein [Flavobacterium sp. CBA20B-1]